MGKTCPHCGMESDDERVCSWCGKPLLEEAAPTEGRERPTQEAAGAEAASAKPQVGAGRARHTGAAADMMAAEAAKDQRAKWPYYLAVVASLALVILGWSAISLRGALQPPQEPEEWQSVSSENDYLRLQVPSNWDVATGGSRGTLEYVQIKAAKSCLIRIKGTLALGAIADANVGSRSEDLSATPFDETRMGEFHAKLGAWVMEEDSNHKEEAMQPCTFTGTRAASSTYTTVRRAGVFAVKTKGWRITTASIGPLAYTIRAECPAKHWDSFKEIAGQIIGSVARSAG